MSYIAKKNTTIFVVEEAVEGTYLAASAGTQAIQPLADGFELKPAKELLERNILSGSIGMATPRTGMKTVTASIPCEFRASDVSGAAPDYDLLLECALGSKNTIGQVTSTSSHTTSKIYMAAEDASGYTAGDIVVVLEAGAYHCSPITAVNETSIELLVAAEEAFSDEVVIEAVTVYSPGESGHPSLTIETWLESVRKEYGAGCKVTGMTLNNFTTGQLADLNFTLEGMSYGQSIGTLGVTASSDDSLPPIILNACVYQDGTAIAVNELTLSVENTLGYITSTCSSNGRISSRVTNRKVTGTINPYKSSENVENYTAFDTGSSFSLFAYAYNPSGTTGEFEQVVALYLPQVLVNEVGAGDADGIVQETLNFTAHRGSGNTTDEIFIASI